MFPERERSWVAAAEGCPISIMPQGLLTGISVRSEPGNGAEFTVMVPTVATVA